LQNDNISLLLRDRSGFVCLWARFGFVNATRGVVDIIAASFPDLRDIRLTLDRLRKEAGRNGAWRLQTALAEGNEMQSFFLQSGFSVEGRKKDAYRIGTEPRAAMLLGSLLEAPRHGPMPEPSDPGPRQTAKAVEIVAAHPDYAAAYLEFDRAVRAETPNLLRTSSEIPSSFSEYKERLCAFNGSDSGSWLAIVSPGTVAGAITGVTPFGPFAEGDVALWIAVRKAYWRQGIGRCLMDALVNWGRIRGVRRLTAEVLSTNDGARAFYLRNGFEVEAVRPLAVFLHGIHLEGLVMGRQI
jgi:RimJ/RimL family protein N-acetyltransferase